MSLWWVSTALGAVPADFSGTWQLDLAASQSVGPLLELVGAGSLERRLADSVSVTQVIEQSEAQVRVTTEAMGKRSESTWPLDGSQVRSETRKGQPQVTWLAWDGSALEARSEVTLESGVVRMVVRRVLEEEGTVMRQSLIVTPPDGATVRADRVFRRQ